MYIKPVKQILQPFLVKIIKLKINKEKKEDLKKYRFVLSCFGFIFFTHEMHSINEIKEMQLRPTNLLRP